MFQEGQTLTDDDTKFIIGYPHPLGSRYLLAVENGKIRGGERVEEDESEEIYIATRLQKYYPVECTIFAANIINGIVRNVVRRYN